MERGIFDIACLACSPFGLFCVQCDTPIETSNGSLRMHFARKHNKEEKINVEKSRKIVERAKQEMVELKKHDMSHFLVNKPKLCYQCSMCGVIIQHKRSWGKHQLSNKGLCKNATMLQKYLQQTVCNRKIPIEEVTNDQPGLEISYKTTRKWVEEIVPEDEEAQSYVSLVHPKTVVGDPLSVIIRNVKLIDEIVHENEIILAKVIKDAKEWMYNRARGDTDSLPANYRRDLATFGGGNMSDEITMYQTFCFRHSEDVLWCEFEKLVKFLFRKTDHPIVAKYVLQFDLYSRNKGYFCNLVTDLMIEECKSVFKYTLLFEYCVTRIFRENKDGELYMTKAQSSGKIAACVLAICRSCACTRLVNCGENITHVAGWLLPLIQKGNFTNMVCPMIRKMRNIDSAKGPKRSKTVHTDGSITVDDFRFENNIWTKLIPKLNNLMITCISNIIDTNCKVFKFLTSKVLRITMNNDFKFTSINECSEIFRSSDIKLRNDFSLSDYDRLQSCLELACSGCGGGSARESDIGHIMKWHARWHDNTLYYDTHTLKVGNQKNRNRSKKYIDHKLCQSQGIIFLVFRAIYEKMKINHPSDKENGIIFSDNKVLLPKRCGRVYSMLDVTAEIFNFNERPNAQQVRQFFTSLADIIFPNQELEGVVIAQLSAAGSCSHSMQTHKNNYRTTIEGGREAAYEKWHKTLGEEIDNQEVVSVEKSITPNDLKASLTKLYGYPGNWTCKEQEKLVDYASNNNNKHTLAMMSCGSGKSAVWEIISLLTDKCTVVIVPYKFLGAYQNATTSQKLGKQFDKTSLSYTAKDITDDKIPEELDNEGLPNIMFLSLEACCNLIQHHHLKLKEWISHNQLMNFVIDEAHCLIIEISFRITYEILPKLTTFGLPVIALSGSLPVPLMRGLSYTLNLQDKSENTAINFVKSNWLFGGYPPEFTFMVHHTLSQSDAITEVVNRSKRLLYSDRGESQTKLHIICENKTFMQEIFDQLEKLFSVAKVASETPTEEQKNIADNWKEGRLDILVSTTVALVGNECKFCHNVIIAGWLFNLMNVVQACGRLRPSQRRSYGSIDLYLPKIITTENNPKWRIDNVTYIRLRDKGIVTNKEDFIEFCSVRGLHNWANSENGCRIERLSSYFGYNDPPCKVCDLCRRTSINIQSQSQNQTLQDDERIAYSAIRILKEMESKCLVCNSRECMGECYSWGQCKVCGIKGHGTKNCHYRGSIKSALMFKGCFSCFDNSNRKDYKYHQRRECPLHEKPRRLINKAFEMSDGDDYLKFLSITFATVPNYYKCLITTLSKIQGK